MFIPDPTSIRLMQESNDTILNMFDWVKERRTSLGVTQQLLSRMTGIPRHYISQIENGHREGVSIQNMVKIAMALNADVVIKENED